MYVPGHVIDLIECFEGFLLKSRIIYLTSALNKILIEHSRADVEIGCVLDQTRTVDYARGEAEDTFGCLKCLQAC